MRVQVEGDHTLAQAPAIAEEVRHNLFHALPVLSDAMVYLDPPGSAGVNPHTVTVHH